MELPKVKMLIKNLPNPNWVAVRGPDGVATNMVSYHVDVELEVEILTVHFQNNTMRVRLPAPWKGTRDVDAAAFFKSYQVVSKTD